jgi:hypothetical protein
MRSFRHWTAKYVINRIGVFWYEFSEPDYPWLSRSANNILDSYLTKSDVGLEFGSGRSTVWFAKRIAHLTAVEHDESWGETVEKLLQKKQCVNVTYHLLSTGEKDNEGAKSPYVSIIDTFDDGSLDFCLVDGSHREFCALKVLEKIRPGGLLVIDNVNWFLCSDSDSPDSRSFANGPNGPIWKEVGDRLSDWRKIWTTSGVSDTALFIKPCN